MTTLTFDFGPDRLTIDDLIVVEDMGEKASIRAMRDMFSRYAVDGETGDTLPEREAKALIGQMTLAQLQSTMQTLDQSLARSSEAAVSGEAKGG